MRPAWLPLAAVLATLACGTRSAEPVPTPLPPLDVPAGCQPLYGNGECFLPYPSDFFRVADPKLPSGFRVEHTGAGKLIVQGGDKCTTSADCDSGRSCTKAGFCQGSADVNDTRPIDGFSKIPTLVVWLPADVSADGLVGLLDPPEGSLSATSPTVIVEASTGARIPHYVDLDPRARDPLRRMIVIHPIVALKEKTRYVVALRGVKQADGAVIAAPEGFRRLRDGAADAALATLQQRFDAEVFPVLKTAGVERKELQLAWDFTTGSDELTSRDTLRVRELTLAWLAKNTPKITITTVALNKSDEIWKTINGTLTAPLFLESADPGARLSRDADGRVKQNGETQVPFMATVPSAVRDQYAPGRPLTYGHGFFGLGEEITYGAPRKIQKTLRTVMFSVDWWGMSQEDTPVVVRGLSGQLSQTMLFTERVPQAMANFMALTNAIPKTLRDAPELRRPTTPGAPGVSLNAAGVSNAGLPLYEETSANYLGISQGHILGGVLSALDPDLSRIVLNVGGAGFTHMMFRARPFNDFIYVLDIGVPDPFEQRKYVATLQAQFDPIDPGFWGQYVLTRPLPGSPADRKVLQQMGLGDTQVPNLGAFLHARTLGLKVLQPSPVLPYGILPLEGPSTDGSALEIFDFGVDLKATYSKDTPPLTESPVHNEVRVQDSALKQMDLFFRKDGKIVHTCDGPCNPN